MVKHENCTYRDCGETAVYWPEDESEGFALCEDHLLEMDGLLNAKPFKPGPLLGFWVRAQGGAETAARRLMGGGAL